MNNEYFTYPLFKEDSNLQRQAYNRLAIAQNIFSSHGKRMCQDYLNQFSKEERGKIFLIGMMREKYGEAIIQRKVAGE